MRAKQGTIWLVMVLASLSHGSAAAQGRRVSMDEAVDLFAANSLALRIARAEADEVRAMARQRSSYFNPALTVVGERLSSGDLRYRETTYGLEQQLEWPGRTVARARATGHLADFAVAEFRADSLRLAFEVRKAYAGVWVAEEREAAVREASAVIARVAESAELRLAEGDISGYEARRLRLERIRAEQELAVSELASASSRRHFATLILPDAGGAEVGPADPLAGVPPAVDAVSALEAVSSRPDLEAAGSAYDAARAFAAAASSGWVPDPTVIFGYKDQTDGFSGAAFSVAVPLPLFDRRAGDAEVARARARAASATLDLRAREARNDVVASTDRYVSTRRRFEQVGEGLPGEAAALLDAATSAYGEGEMTMLELLDAARAFRETRVTAATLRADLWIAYYDLLRAIGRAPEED